MDMTRKLLKHLLLNIWVITLILFVFCQENIAQANFTFERDSPPTMQMLVDAREVFEYEVRYGFLTLGWVDVELLPDTTISGEKAYHMRTRIRSNSRIPFAGTRIVNYENIFQFNERWPYSHVFWRDDIHDEEYESAKIIFDREHQIVHFYEKGEFMESLDLVEPASGGDIIFYYSRMFAGIRTPYELPAYIENELGFVRAQSSPEIELRRYDAFDEPVRAYLSEGTADIDGPFGFRGRFRSWFSADDLRVPLEAHVRVIFGNVKVRLISYERHGSH